MKREFKVKLWDALMDLGHVCGCHQKPERSFFYKNYQLPFCARCMGVILGEIILGPILLAFGINLYLYSGILLIPLVIDGLLQFLTSYESNNFKRLATGILGGIGITMLLINLILLMIK